LALKKFVSPADAVAGGFTKRPTSIGGQKSRGANLLYFFIGSNGLIARFYLPLALLF
jgi:hypothetical protein